MKYYFYDENGVVNLIYSVEPPIELGNKYIKSSEEFEEREGYILRLRVVNGSLVSEYEKLSMSEYDKIIEENEATKQALAELTLLISTMNGGM